MGGGMWLGSLFMLALVGILIWAVLRGSGMGTASGRSPEEILKERYARGEIDAEEYERRLQDLRK